MIDCKEWQFFESIIPKIEPQKVPSSTAQNDSCRNAATNCLKQRTRQVLRRSDIAKPTKSSRPSHSQLTVCCYSFQQSYKMICKAKDLPPAMTAHTLSSWWQTLTTHTQKHTQTSSSISTAQAHNTISSDRFVPNEFCYSK